MGNIKKAVMISNVIKSVLESGKNILDPDLIAMMLDNQ